MAKKKMTERGHFSEKNIQLTQSQLMLWVGQKLHPKSAMYNMAHSFEIFDTIDERVFKKSFQRLVDSCDVFRIVFSEDKGIPRQNILENFSYDLEIIDHSDKSLDETKLVLQKRTERLFNLSEPLFDSALYKIDAARYIWFLNFHHLVTDATSSTILFENFSKIYTACLNNELQALPQIPQYRDYLHYERAISEDGKFDGIRDYWRQTANKSSGLPLFYGEDNTTNTSSSKRTKISIGKERIEKLDALASKPEFRCWTKDLTYFNIFLTTLFVLIKKLSGKNNIAVGALSHSRVTHQFKKTPGMFVELFPIVSTLSSDDTFAALYRKVREETNDYLKNAQPGMVSKATSTGFNVILNYIKSSFTDFNNSAVKSEWIHPNHCDPSHHLRLGVHDMDNTGEIELYFDLNEAVFNKSRQDQLPHHFLSLLDAFLGDQEAQIVSEEFEQESPKNLDSSTTLHRIHNDTITLDSNDFEIVKDNVLLTFENMAEQQPNTIAIQENGKVLTYSDLNKRSNQLAHVLIKSGVVENTKVVLYNYRSINYIIGVLAVMKARGTFVPVAADQPKERLEFIISDSGCKLVLTEDLLASQLEDIEVSLINLEVEKDHIENESSYNLDLKYSLDNIAYVLYTSGSTGNPKGVLISNRSLANYIFWAKDYYNVTNDSIFPLFTSIGFDLTITSTLLPLVSGGKIVLYAEDNSETDFSLLQVINDNLVNTIKLTPSHLSLIKDKDLSMSHIKTMIVGGEDFKVNLAQSILDAFGKPIKLYNEYGPTEAAVGCIAGEFSQSHNALTSVPIGQPIKNMHAYILDSDQQPVRRGASGDLYLSGTSLANGYLNLNELTDAKFIDNPFVNDTKMYHTGDLARVNDNGEYEYLGRVDEQVKLRGYRIELADIEANMSTYEGVDNCAVVLVKNNVQEEIQNDVMNCAECGLPSNYPQTDFDDHGVCNLCNSFKGYKHKVDRYFKTEADLKNILLSTKGRNPKYDCLSLLSGGKDSTYILARLVSMGLKVLAFTLDNGYISDQAKANIDRIVEKLGVDHIYGETEHMNAIFVDSLKRHKNVCNGCFKAIYTLSSHLAIKHQIPFIVTGLSRGQFFETRLTEELFWADDLDVKKIDDTILEVRKLYHHEKDAVKELLDTSIFENGEFFDKVQFVDFYRYTDVSLAEMLKFLDEKIGWIRPTDTGRSTNCLINQVGIYVHKKQKGYSNYAFPYSWDVRLGHKTRDESLEEINEYIHEPEVKRIMKEIGYEEPTLMDSDERLVAFYTANTVKTSKELKSYLEKKLPSYMIPSSFEYLEKIPLTKNGKIDRQLLRDYNVKPQGNETEYVAPRNDIEELVESIWKEVLVLERIGVHDNFIDLGGHSLAAIRVTSRVNEELETNIPLSKVFDLPTIETYANHIEMLLTSLLEE